MEAPAPHRSNQILSIRHLSKTFHARSRNPVQAIDDVTLDVERGEFLGIVGPSGGGKTTLLKSVAGLLPITSGDIVLNGRTVVGPIDDVGIAFQQPVLLPWRTALDNVLLPIEMLGDNPGTKRDEALRLLQIVGLAGFEERRPRELSGGMQQRVALCRALIHDPPILLMDEPFGAVDEFTREALNDHLLRLWEERQKTVLFVTHSVAESVYLSDRVAILTARPARVVDVVRIDLPRPRRAEIRYSTAFAEHTRAIQEKLRAA